MQVVSVVWGVFAFIGMVVGFLPFLSALNWLNLPFSGVGVILSVIALVTAKPAHKGTAIVALVANGIVLAILVARLFFLGGGIL
jgi:hypothetical protein